MEFLPLQIPGCYLIRVGHTEDERGSFDKLFHAPTFTALSLESKFEESYVTTSRKGVVRGMHFQMPPFDHAKLVSCIQGRVLDGLVDLRCGSPMYKRSVSIEISEEAPSCIYIPRGVAHGFAAYEEDSRLLYFVTSAYNKEADSGVLWNSVGIDWWKGLKEEMAEIVSVRDMGFTTLEDFKSPFVYKHD